MVSGNHILCTLQLNLYVILTYIIVLPDIRMSEFIQSFKLRLLTYLFNLALQIKVLCVIW